MKWSTVLVAALMAAGSLHAAGTIKPYTNRAAFAAEDAVDWGALTSLAGGDKGVNIAPTFTGLRSGLGTVVISGGVPQHSSLNRFNEGISFFGNFTGGDRLLTTMPGDLGPIAITFTSGPVFGAGLQIENFVPGAFTGQMKAFDSAGNLLGTVAVNGVTTTHSSLAPADNTAPFIGIRSSVKEIAKLEIDTPGTFGFAVNRLDVALGASPILNSSFFVNQLYQDLLSRVPTSVELAAGATVLANPATGLGDLAYTVFTSAEFHDNANYLAKCYLAMLGRDPDITTWPQILKLLQTGTQQVTALSGFLSAPEYLAAYPDTLSTTQYVTRLYNNLLGRAPEAAGLAYWTFLINIGIPKVYILNGFIVSPEYDARMAHRVNANLAYISFLRRTGEPAGINYWTVVQDFGVPLSSMLGSFVSSPEYLGRF
jgi:hypothetical protein